jgi:hypothetical protein|tara:strand:+ start:1011 stop:1199 length:189 start_codon:yes stop_codon:yes gene_type:complete
MPVKFKESEQILVDRNAKKYKTVHHYLQSTPTADIQKAIDSGNAKPKHKQKWKNELIRRGVM